MRAETPQRSNIRWRESEYLQEPHLDSQLRDVFDICSTCRKCTSLCDSFPRLFDLIDSTKNQNIESVDSKRFADVMDACTLCDMCYPICPYITPHDYQIDFPSMVIRYRAVQRSKGDRDYQQDQLAQTDRNGRLFCYWSRFINWVTNKDNVVTRLILQWVAGIDRGAVLPKFQQRRFSRGSFFRPSFVSCF